MIEVSNPPAVYWAGGIHGSGIRKIRMTTIVLRMPFNQTSQLYFPKYHFKKISNIFTLLPRFHNQC